MNNASLVLNVAAPSPSMGQAPAAPSNDGTSAGRGFDAAMAAAHVDAGKPNAAPAPPPKPKPATSQDTTQANSPDHDASTPTQAKASATPDDDTAKDDDGSGKDDKADGGDTSIAAAMLALIGVPPKAQPAAPTVPADAVGDAADSTATALGLGGLPPLGADVASAAAGIKDGLVDPLGTGANAAVATTPDAAAAASVFASLLATQATDATPDKSDARSATDPLQASPMPMLHNPAPNVVAVPQLQATHPAASPQFAQELGEQIAWMGAGQLKEAQIKLHPEELGTMDVRVNLDGGKVNVAIMAQHPAAVHAVQQTLSQLDSMLAHHGLELGQANVGQRQAGQGGEGGGSAQGQSQGGDDSVSGAPVAATSRVSRGLLDEVA
ncbi:flagellar hook-length control protein FliK [Luteibacter aegosomatis]|uniref:flagellar hook-length control protein FliK n=1 Tax=Luteibacter aegosomatis TaxID=2911537 RepID=UPI001FF90019|nr:flagellar hook-length control protein FliK [Luteibacter aegosomatis]UPG86910.1 flagellar hook-length control protein FliK [Luteibacter aegosomatis]